MIVSPEKPSHWYLPNGTPFHEVERVDGKGMRPTTIRDARKVGAFPSVTNILDVLRKPALEAWKIEQGILAALTLPRQPDETDDAFAKRVAQDADAYSKSAMDLGTQVHAACEMWLLEKMMPAEEKIESLTKPFRVWADENIKNLKIVETVLIGNGYGGKVDLVADVKDVGLTVIDLKTQNVKNGKVNYYETWPLQLEAYRRACKKIKAKSIASLVISSSEPMPVAFRVWSKEDYPMYWKVFQSIFEAWKYMKDYNPIEKEK
ncbi:MAG: hypothetical protein QXH80_00020 [Candidatus Nanoarchaeia archaeon]